MNVLFVVKTSRPPFFQKPCEQVRICSIVPSPNGKRHI